MVKIETLQDNAVLQEEAAIYSAAEAGPQSLGLQELLGPEYNYLEPGKWDREETRVKMGTDENMVVNPYKIEQLSPEEREKVDYWNLKEGSLTLIQVQTMIQILDDNSEAFAKDEYDLGRFPLWEHHLDTGDSKPVKVRCRPMSEVMKNNLRPIIDNLLKTDQIRPSRSPWASGIVMVPKKNNTWRMCVDYRGVNKVAACSQFPLPRINDIFASLRGARYFTAIDLAKGFHQLKLDEATMIKLAFITPIGLFQPTTVPMGLHTSPAWFQEDMDYIFGDQRHRVLVYIDDIIVFTRTFEEHQEALIMVFSRLIEYNMKASRTKCEFARTELTYLGHVVNSLGISTDPKKIEAVKNMPEPTCILELESFLGKAGYYQRFIDDYANIVVPLNALKKKNAQFRFTDVEREAFNKIKAALISAPLLSYPDFDRPFCISTDASGYGLGAVLFQQYGEDGSEEKPVAYASRTLKPAELRYSATEREALGVWWACDHFIDYIDLTPVTVYTDHKALVALSYKDLNNRRLRLIAHKLSEFRVTIKYRPGRYNTNADTLSRYPIAPLKGHKSRLTQTNESSTNNFDPEANLEFSSTGRVQLEPKVPKPKSNKKTLEKTMAIHALQLRKLESTRAVDKIMKNIVFFQNKIPLFRALRYYVENGKWPEDQHLPGHISGILDEFYIDPNNGALCKIAPSNKAELLCTPSELRATVLHDAHNVPVAAHMGIAKTLARVKEGHWWPGMLPDITWYINNCDMCTAHKTTARIHREKMGNRPPPTRPWERVHIDIWTPGGPASEDMICVLGVIDAFSKYLILLPMADHRTETIAETLTTGVFLKYGTPEELVSDNEPSFRSELQAEFLKTFGITRKLITPNRPPANGQIERVFRTIRPMLAIVTSRAPRRWARNLRPVEYAMNTAYIPSLRSSAFYLMFGRHPLPGPDRWSVLVFNDNRERIARWKRALVFARQALKDEQDRVKEYFDRTKANPQPTYQEGDHVLAKTLRIPNGAIPKLYPKYIGPYLVTKMEGPVATVFPVNVTLPASRILQRPFKMHIDRLRPCKDIHFNVFTWRELISPFIDPALIDPHLEAEAETDEEGDENTLSKNNEPIVAARLDDIPELEEPEGDDNNITENHTKFTAGQLEVESPEDQ